MVIGDHGRTPRRTLRSPTRLASWRKSTCPTGPRHRHDPRDSRARAARDPGLDRRARQRRPDPARARRAAGVARAPEGEPARRARDPGGGRRRVHRARRRTRRRGPAGGPRGRRRASRSTSIGCTATAGPRSRSTPRSRGAGRTTRRASATSPSGQRCRDETRQLPPARRRGAARRRRRGRPRRRRPAGRRHDRPWTAGCAAGDRSPATGATFALDAVTLLAPHTPRAIFGIGLNYRAHAAETGKELPEAPIVFLKLPTSVAPPGGPVRCAAGRQAPGLRGRARGRAGPGRRRRRLRGRRRRQRARPAAPRAAVDPRQGVGHVLPVRAVGHDGRRDRRPRGPEPADLGQRRAAPGRAHVGSRLLDPRADRVPARDDHARARRPDPDRHAERRRHGAGSAAVPGARRRRAHRDRVLGAIEHVIDG